MTTLAPQARFRAFDANGNPLAGGKLYTYQAGTSTPLATYTDQGGGTPNANPVVLDANGEANVWLSSSAYKFVLKDANDVTQWTVDNILSSEGSIFADLANSTDAAKGDALVAMKQPVTGAVARTVHDKLQETISVLDFGAKGDNGTTDNYAAFAAALSYLGTLTYGGTLRVPGGALNRYVFKAQGSSYPNLQIPSNVSIVADPDVYYIVDAIGLANSGVHIYGTALFQNKNSLSTGSKNISIINGSFKSANATSGATGNGGFIAFKNCLNPKVQGVKLLDTFGAARLQLSFCYGAKLLDGMVDYETAHLTPWSYEDGIRIGSGCINTDVANWLINSGDDCIAINNEASECQDAFSSPVDSRIPTSNLAGAAITGVTITNIACANQNGNALRLYIGPGMTAGAISRVKVKNINGATKSPSAGGTVISALDSGSAGADQIYDVVIDGGTLDCSQLTAIGAPAVSIGSKLADFVINGLTLLGNTGTYGISGGPRARITNNKIVGAVNDGIYTAAADNYIAGNHISGVGVAGIHVDNGATHTRLIGNRVSSSTGAAILETAGATYTVAEGNDVQGAGACSIAVNTGNVYRDNPGLNPVGSFAIGPTGSPFTYTTAYLPETVTVGGGTVSSITINGVGTALTSGAFHLPPHTPIVVTYSVGPTMSKTVH